MINNFHPEHLEMSGIDFLNVRPIFFDLPAGALLSDNPAMSYKGRL